MYIVVQQIVNKWEKRLILMKQRGLLFYEYTAEYMIESLCRRYLGIDT